MTTNNTVIEKIIAILDSLTLAKGENIKRVDELSGVDDRNFVRMVLDVLKGLGLVYMDAPSGREKTYRIADKTYLFSSILKEDYRRLANETSNLILALGNYSPGKVEMDNEIDRFLITSRLESNRKNSPFSKLQAITDAFCLAVSTLDPHTPEHEIAEDVSTLLKSSQQHLLSIRNSEHENGMVILGKAKSILSEAAEAKKAADELGLTRRRLDFKKVGTNGRGRPIYQVKSSG